MKRTRHSAPVIAVATVLLWAGVAYAAYPIYPMVNYASHYNNSNYNYNNNYNNNANGGYGTYSPYWSMYWCGSYWSYSYCPQTSYNYSTHPQYSFSSNSYPSSYNYPYYGAGAYGNGMNTYGNSMNGGMYGGMYGTYGGGYQPMTNYYGSSSYGSDQYCYSGYGCYPFPVDDPHQWIQDRWTGEWY